MNNAVGAVQELPAKENKRKESRAVISAKAQRNIRGTLPMMIGGNFGRSLQRSSTAKK